MKMAKLQRNYVKTNSYCAIHGAHNEGPIFNRNNNEPRTLMAYCNLIFKNSTIPGVTHIAGAKGRIKKLVWFTIFIGCVAGFTYQVSEFLIYYCHFPTRVEVIVQTEGVMNFPSVTLCNNNRIKKSAYCKLNNSHCNVDASDYNEFTLQEKEIVDFQLKMLLLEKTHLRNSLGHNITDMIVSCVFTGVPPIQGEDCIGRFEHFYDPDFGNCYSFESLEGDDLKVSESDVWQEISELVLILNVDEEEHMEPSRDPGIVVTFHNSDEYPDAFSDGREVRPGFSYKFGLKKTTVKLLPHPYQTNCTEYENLEWQKENERTGSTRMCTVHCSQTLQLEKCNAVTDEVSLFFDRVPYSRDKNERDAEAKCAKMVSEETKEYCRTLCRVPCSQSSFEVETDSSLWPTRKQVPLIKELGKWRNESYEEIQQSLCRVRIYFSTMDHTIYQHTPIMKAFELFSHIGGLIGVWLGTSLIAVCEFLDRAASVVSVCMRRYKAAEKRKKKKTFKVSSLPNSKLRKKVVPRSEWRLQP